jgi:hypothetical protein
MTTIALTAWRAQVALKLHTVALGLIRGGDEPQREQVGRWHQGC